MIAKRVLRKTTRGVRNVSKLVISSFLFKFVAGMVIDTTLFLVENSGVVVYAKPSDVDHGDNNRMPSEAASKFHTLFLHLKGNVGLFEMYFIP